MAAIDDLAKAVQDITDAVNSAITDIQNLAATIKTDAANPVAMEDAATKLETLATNLKNAVNPPTTP